MFPTTRCQSQEPLGTLIFKSVNADPQEEGWALLAYRFNQVWFETVRSRGTTVKTEELLALDRVGNFDKAVLPWWKGSWLSNRSICKRKSDNCSSTACSRFSKKNPTCLVSGLRERLFEWRGEMKSVAFENRSRVKLADQRKWCVWLHSYIIDIFFCLEALSRRT